MTVPCGTPLSISTYAVITMIIMQYFFGSCDFTYLFTRRFECFSVVRSYRCMQEVFFILENLGKANRNARTLRPRVNSKWIAWVETLNLVHRVCPFAG
jgi:hypothetical protein